MIMGHWAPTVRRRRIATVSWVAPESRAQMPNGRRRDGRAHRAHDRQPAQMSVSPFTVKTHAVRAMTKVGARDRAQLVTFAFRAGLCP
jgi:Bacterial regulatory proteins, luxR family